MRWGEIHARPISPGEDGGSILGAAFRCGSSLRLIHALNSGHDHRCSGMMWIKRGRMPVHQRASALSAIRLRRLTAVQSVSCQLRSRSLLADALFIALLEA